MKRFTGVAYVFDKKFYLSSCIQPYFKLAWFHNYKNLTRFLGKFALLAPKRRANTGFPTNFP